MCSLLLKELILYYICIHVNMDKDVKTISSMPTWSYQRRHKRVPIMILSSFIRSDSLIPISYKIQAVTIASKTGHG